MSTEVAQIESLSGQQCESSRVGFVCVCVFFAADQRSWKSFQELGAACFNAQHSGPGCELCCLMNTLVSLSHIDLHKHPPSLTFFPFINVCEHHQAHLCALGLTVESTQQHH